MSRLRAALLALLFAAGATAQEKVERFVVTACPMKSGVNKDTFNLQHARITDDAVFQGALRKAFGTTLDGKVRYERHVKGKRTQFWAYDIPTARTTHVTLATMASKGTLKEMAQNRAELRDWLSGTVALHEELRMRVRLADADYPATGYYLLWAGPDGAAKRVQVPAARDTLILHPGLFGAEPPPVVAVRLRNRAKPGTDLAVGTLRILSPAERADLADLACEGARYAGITARDSIALLAQQLSDTLYGRTYPSRMPPVCAP